MDAPLIAAPGANEPLRHPIHHNGKDTMSHGITNNDSMFSVRQMPCHGIVSHEYEAVDNRDAFRFLDALIGSDLHFETAGSLWAGRRVWCLARLPEYVEPGGRPVGDLHLCGSGPSASATPWGSALAELSQVVRIGSMGFDVGQAGSSFRGCSRVSWPARTSR